MGADDAVADPPGAVTAVLDAEVIAEVICGGSTLLAVADEVAVPLLGCGDGEVAMMVMLLDERAVLLMMTSVELGGV